MLNLLFPFDSLPLNGVTWIFILAVLTHLKKNNFYIKRQISYKNKVAFITGGSEGSGLAVAKYFIRRGGSVTIVSRSEKKLEIAKEILEKEIQQYISKNSNKKIDDQKINQQQIQQVFTYSADVSNYEAVQKALIFSNQKHQIKSPEYVIMAAGLAKPGYFVEQDIKIYRQLMEVNYFGCLNTAKAAVEIMIKEKQRGKLVFFSSAVACCGMAGYSQYSPTKFALRGLCDSLHTELIPHNIDIHLFLPSNIDTPGFEVENQTKPIETREIEGSAQTFTADQVANDLFEGIQQGQYTITNETLIEISRITTDGAVKTNNLFADILFSPFIPIFRFLFSQYQQFVIKKHSQNRLKRLSQQQN